MLESSEWKANCCTCDTTVFAQVLHRTDVMRKLPWPTITSLTPAPSIFNIIMTYCMPELFNMMGQIKFTHSQCSHIVANEEPVLLGS